MLRYFPEVYDAQGKPDDDVGEHKDEGNHLERLCKYLKIEHLLTQHQPHVEGYEMGYYHHFANAPEDVPAFGQIEMVAAEIEGKPCDEQYHEHDAGNHRDVERVEAFAHVEKGVDIEGSIDQCEYDEGQWQHHDVEHLSAEPIERVRYSGHDFLLLLVCVTK